MNDTSSGLVTLPTQHPVKDLVARLEQILHTKGARIFALIDHSGEAEKAGFKMPDTKLVIFGDPKAGTPLMLAAPTIAIDLPMKLLFWEDAQGQVWITYNGAEFLKSRHHLPADLVQVLAGPSALAANLAT